MWSVVEELPFALARALPLTTDLPNRDLTQSFYSIASLCVRCPHLASQGEDFLSSAASLIFVRAKEMDLKSIIVALRGLALLARTPLSSKDALLPLALFDEIRQHIPVLGVRDAVMIINTAQRLAPVQIPGSVLDLLSAEVLRESRRLRSQDICDVIVGFGTLRFNSPGFFIGASETLRSTLATCSPKALSLSLHGLVKVGVAKDLDILFRDSSEHIKNNIVAFESRELILCFWSFVKASHYDEGLFEKIQDDARRSLRQGTLCIVDASMLLWSLSQLEGVVEDVLLSGLSDLLVRSQEFSLESLLVTCVAFTKLGFARQPVLVQLYRRLYGQLPKLGGAQLAFAFFLFSTSGIHDEPLISRFLFECKRHLPNLRGQALSNALLACTRSRVPGHLAEPSFIKDGLRTRIFEELENLPPSPLLGVWLAGPDYLSFTEDENMEVMDALHYAFPLMDAGELSRCLVATAKAKMMHKPFLLPLFHYLRKAREDLTTGEIVSSIWAVHSLGFCKPDLRRSLGHLLMTNVRRGKIPARVLLDVLPALNEFGYWERLPGSLRRSIWRLASEDMRRGLSAPPAFQAPRPQDGDLLSTDNWKQNWRLPVLTPGLVKRWQRRKTLSELHQMQSLDTVGEEASGELKEQEEFARMHGSESGSGQSAMDDFVEMLRKV